MREGETLNLHFLFMRQFLLLGPIWVFPIDFHFQERPWLNYTGGNIGTEISTH